MVSLYMPDVQVEIAWDSGYATPAASRTWTDVSAYVELADRIDIGFGRQDERSTADANTLTLTLDNTDGRFTAFRAASPYYPNVKLGRPIRVTATPPGGTASVRFTGFVDEWPVEWDGADRYAKAQIKASSRLARLGLTNKLRSMPEMEILFDRPLAYWTLGEATGSTSASDSSGNNGVPLNVVGTLAAMTFGNATGAPTDGLTAATFAGGQYLRIAQPVPTIVGAYAARAMVRVTSAPATTATVIGTDGKVDGIRINTSGQVLGNTSTGPNIADDLTHDVVVTDDGTTERLYVDGAQVANGAGGNGLFGDLVVGLAFDGTVGHVAVYGGAPPSAEQVAEMSTAVFGTPERTDLRYLRLLRWVGVAANETEPDTGSETMTYQKTSGQSVVDALRDVESTESGVLFDDRDGDVAFHNRSRRYLATPAVTLNMAAQHVGADYSPKLDRSTLLNDVEVSNPTTDEKARAVDTDSADEYGIATGTATSVADSYDPLQQKAAWLIASYAEPRSRVPSLTVDVLAHQGGLPSSQDLLALTVGDLIAVTNAPMQADTADTSYFVEGYTETIGPESYDISFNLSPSHPSLSTLVLDSATRGLLDTGILAY